jgi:hypothetical protein
MSDFGRFMLCHLDSIPDPWQRLGALIGMDLLNISSFTGDVELAVYLSIAPDSFVPRSRIGI